jgi:hypothetical protein
LPTKSKDRVAATRVGELLFTFDEVVKALGGVSKVARLVDQPPSAVSNWRRVRGKFPPKYYMLFQHELQEAGYRAAAACFSFVPPTLGKDRSQSRGR